MRRGDDFTEFCGVEGGIQSLAVAARDKVLNGLAETLAEYEATPQFLADLAMNGFQGGFEGLQATAWQQQSVRSADGSDQALGVGHHGVGARSCRVRQCFASDPEYVNGLFHPFQ